MSLPETAAGVTLNRETPFYDELRASYRNHGFDPQNLNPKWSIAAAKHRIELLKSGSVPDDVLDDRIRLVLTAYDEPSCSAVLKSLRDEGWTVSESRARKHWKPLRQEHLENTTSRPPRPAPEADSGPGRG